MYNKHSYLNFSITLETVAAFCEKSKDVEQILRNQLKVVQILSQLHHRKVDQNLQYVLQNHQNVHQIHQNDLQNLRSHVRHLLD